MKTPCSHEGTLRADYHELTRRTRICRLLVLHFRLILCEQRPMRIPVLTIEIHERITKFGRRLCILQAGNLRSLKSW